MLDEADSEDSCVERRFGFWLARRVLMQVCDLCVQYRLVLTSRPSTTDVSSRPRELVEFLLLS
jgi:hypothetical protein